MSKTLTQLLNGDDMEGGENFCDEIYNNLKNHFRSAGPCAALTLLKLGMLLSDSADNRLQHRVIVAAAEKCIEVLQAPHVVCADNEVVCVDNEVVTAPVI